MQLVVLTEPESLNIKKSMSTLSETFDQVNDNITDNIDNETTGKPSPCRDSNKCSTKNTELDKINEEIYVNITEHNGITKINGNSHINNTLKNDEELLNENSKENIENNSSTVGESNVCMDEDTPVEIGVIAKENTCLANESDNQSINRTQFKDKIELTNGLKASDIKNDKVDIDQEITSLPLDKTETNISTTDIDVSSKESAFSPYCDEKDFKITEQLQLLDKDKLKDEECIPLTDAVFVPDKVSLEKNEEIEVDQTEKEEEFSSDIKETQNNEVSVHNQPLAELENQNSNVEDNKDADSSSIKLVEIYKDKHEKDSNKISSVDDKPEEFTTTNGTAVEKSVDDVSENSTYSDEKEIGLVNSDPIENMTAEEKNIEENIPAVKSTETEINNETEKCLATDGNIGIISADQKESDVAVVQQQTTNPEKHLDNDLNNMEIDDGNDTIKRQREAGEIQDQTDKASVEHKYITVKKLTDLTDSFSSTNGTREIEDPEIGEIETVRNELMDIDETDKVSSAVPKDNVDLINSSIELHRDEMQSSQTNIDLESTENIAVDITVDQMKSNIEKLNKNTMDIDIEELVEDKPDHENAIGESKKDDTQEIVTQKGESINVFEKDDEIRQSPHKNNDVSNNVSVSENTSEVISVDDTTKETVAMENKESTDVEIVGDDDVKVVEEQCEVEQKNQSETIHSKTLPVVCKLSNTMDILSDDEDETPYSELEKQVTNKKAGKDDDDSKCINLDDDDEIMFIEDNSQEANQEPKPEESVKVEIQTTEDSKPKTINSNEDEKSQVTNDNGTPKISEKDDPSVEFEFQPTKDLEPVEPSEVKSSKPLITKTFLKTVTKNLADMTRSELEDFCILQLVESIAERSNLNEIKNKMKTLVQTIEDLKKKSQALIKQNRDLHLVVKTVQGDQKKRCPNPMMPMKITRSVGMQVLLAGQSQMQLKKKLPLPPTPPAPAPTPAPARSVRNVPSPKTPKPTANNIPVPRLVPAVSPTAAKSPSAQNNTKPLTAPRNTTQQRPEKRTHNKLSPGSSVTVDLTDDEPPAKIISKTPTPPVRLVPSQNLMAKSRPQFPPNSNSPRKVYIPISANAPTVRPGLGAGVMKNFVAPTRPRLPVVRMPNRVNQSITSSRHPAPLPDAMKQYQPPTWKSLPPPPDLKLSKVDNGIVISWKFEGYPPDSYEEVASFQLYAYQETPAPPSTALWKKIGDIKALPLPMACTLTQFMSGFKYYFAVRAIDVRSRIGPFSMPGSIMLISKS